MSEEETISLSWKTIIVLVVIFSIAFAIYLIGKDKDIMYNLCRSESFLGGAIKLISSIANPGSISCSGLR